MNERKLIRKKREQYFQDNKSPHPKNKERKKLEEGNKHMKKNRRRTAQKTHQQGFPVAVSRQPESRLRGPRRLRVRFLSKDRRSLESRETYMFCFPFSLVSHSHLFEVILNSEWRNTRNKSRNCYRLLFCKDYSFGPVCTLVVPSQQNSLFSFCFSRLFLSSFSFHLSTSFFSFSFFLSL